MRRHGVQAPCEGRTWVLWMQGVEADMEERCACRQHGSVHTWAMHDMEAV